MTPEEARAFLRPALEPGAETPSPVPAVWADLGAGEGTFTRALAALLPPGSRIIAMDRDPGAIAALERLARETVHEVEIVPVRGDLARLPGEQGDLSPGKVELSGLDGVLLANVLHFLPDPLPLLEALCSRVVPGGRIVVVEYDREEANRWVPHPLVPTRLDRLAGRAGLASPRIVARRRSRYQGEMYMAVTIR